MEKKLSILIPAYNQVSLARRCLYYLSEQTYKNFLVILQDDAGQENYQNLCKEYPDLEIIYSRNKENLGAIVNMIDCLTKKVETEFTMCLHEDDFIHSEYIAQAINILEKNNGIAFVGSPAYFFEPGTIFNRLSSLENDWQKYSLAEFIDYSLNKNKLVFGSIIYRHALIKSEFLNLTKYDVFLDRPFLLSILQNSNKKAAIFKNCFYYYQNHPYPDKRWESLSIENVINLYLCYENLAPGRGRSITSQYIFDFANLENKKWSEFWEFMKIGKEKGLVSWRRISVKFILASLFIFIFGKKHYYNLFTTLKKLTKTG